MTIWVNFLSPVKKQVGKWFELLVISGNSKKINGIFNKYTVRYKKCSDSIVNLICYQSLLHLCLRNSKSKFETFIASGLTDSTRELWFILSEKLTRSKTGNRISWQNFFTETKKSERTVFRLNREISFKWKSVKWESLIIFLKRKNIRVMKFNLKKLNIFL